MHPDDYNKFKKVPISIDHVPSALNPSYCPTCKWNTAGIEEVRRPGVRICPRCRMSLHQTARRTNRNGW